MKIRPWTTAPNKEKYFLIKKITASIEHATLILFKVKLYN
jgi:hypothetical protein